MRPTLRLAAGLAAATVAAWVAVCAGEFSPRSPRQVPEQPASDVEAFLAAHNAVRRKAGVIPVRWSADLSTLARSRARELAGPCILDHGGLPDGIGENLLRALPSAGTPALDPDAHLVAPSRVVAAWAAEEANFDYASNRCAPGRQCGHYTQLVWGTTDEVGCAASRCASQAEIWVCNYRPGGNVAGLRPY